METENNILNDLAMYKFTSIYWKRACDIDE